jgi:chromosome segregation ATPase
MDNQYINKFISNKQQQIIYDLTKCNERMNIIKGLRNTDSNIMNHVSKLLERKYQKGGAVGDNIGVIPNVDDYKDIRIKTQLERLNEHFKNTKDNLNKLEIAISKLKQAEKESSDKIKGLEAQIQDLNNLIIDKDNEITKLKKELGELGVAEDEKLKKLQEEKEALQNELDRLYDMLKTIEGINNNINDATEALVKQAEL